MQKQAEWNNFKNILCVRLDNMGDVLMTSPALRAIKTAIPGRKITLLTSSIAYGIAKLLPEIDAVICFDPPWMKGKGKRSREAIDTILQEIKKHQFDAAILFTVYSQNPLPAAMLCYQAGILSIAGLCRENPYQLIHYWLPDKEPLYEIKHEVQRQLDLVAFLGAIPKQERLSVPKISPGAKETMLKKLKLAGVDTAKKWIVLHPGASEEKRQYAPSLFAAAVALLSEKLEYQILITGVEEEKTLTDTIAGKSKKSFSLAGLFSLEEFIALLQSSSLLLSNNTGPVHIAAALETPVIVLYALTNPQHTPWKVAHKIFPFDVPKKTRSKNVIIRYAYESCFLNPPKKITAQGILASVKEMLQNKKEYQKVEPLLL